MTNSQVGKRKYVSKVRRVTSCSECHRRKQKCNRQRPCAGCVSRGLLDRCVYDTIDSPQQLHTPVSTRESESVDSSLIQEVDTTTISNGIGYVAIEHTDLSSPGLPKPVSNITRTSRSQPVNLPQDASSRIIALLDHIPEPSLTKRFVDIFFGQANWYFSVLDRCFFGQRHRIFLIWLTSDSRDHVDREISYFGALLLQVIALALQFLTQADRTNPVISSFTQPTPDERSRACSEAGESILNLLNRRQPNLSSVEADIMRCAWLKNSGYGIDAWYNLSNAVRQAQDLRLHLEPNMSIQDENSAEYLQEVWNYEHRRRIWACLITWEAHMSLQLGRPRMINLSDCSVRRPTNCDAPIDPARTLLRPTALPSEVPSHYTSHMVKYEIALLIHQAMNIGLLHPDYESISDVHAMHFELELILSNVPPAFKSDDPDTSWDLIYPNIPKLRLQIRIVAQSFFLALHRPHVFTDLISLRTAVQSAKSVLDLSQELFELVEENQYKTFTLIFYTIDSGIFLAAALAKFNDTQISQSVSPDSLVDTLEHSIKRLEFLEQFHSVTKAGGEVLKLCLNRIRHQRQMSTSVQLPPTPSPVTGSETNVFGQTVTPTNGSNVVDEYWASLLNDSAFTASWLENQLDSAELDFGYFDNFLPDMVEVGQGT